MPQEMMLEAFVPDFSGFSSPAWVELLSGPRLRAAAARDFLQMSDYRLNRDDYLEIFAEAGDYAKQCTELAKSFCDIFAIHLAVKLGIPHGVRFARYDHAFDRVVALVPLRTVRWILDHCGEKRHRSLDGLKPSDFEALWDFAPEASDLQSEAVTRAMRMMDPAAAGKLLRAFGNPGIEKTAIRAIAVDGAALAFANSIDPDKYRAARDRRRREKYPFAFGRPTNP
jgi:hypothetical protein